MRHLTLDITISADRYETLYRGARRDVQVVSHEGLRVRFPGRILQRFVDRNEVHGTFVIEFDDNNKFKAITKIV